MLLLIRLLIELPWETSRIPSKVLKISWCWEKILNVSRVSVKWREEIRGTSGFFTEERHSNPGRGVTYGVKLALNIEKSKNKIEQCQLHQLSSFKCCPRGLSWRKALLNSILFCNQFQVTLFWEKLISMTAILPSMVLIVHWVPPNSEVHPQDPYSWGSPHALGSQVETLFCEGRDIK